MSLTPKLPEHLDLHLFRHNDFAQSFEESVAFHNTSKAYYDLNSSLILTTGQFSSSFSK